MSAVLVLARVRRLLLLVGLVFAALPVGSALADTFVGAIGGGGGSCSGPGVWADSGYVVPAGGGTISAYTHPRNGKGDAFCYCKASHPGAIQPRWTRELVLEAMRGRQARHGRLPSSYDWSRTHMRSERWAGHKETG